MGETVDFGPTPILTEHLAQVLHDRYCTVHRPERGFRDKTPHGGCMFNDDHVWTREAGLIVASMLPRMGELFDVIRRDERGRLAPQPEYGCTFDCSICHQDCQEWGCREHEAAT